MWKHPNSTITKRQGRRDNYHLARDRRWWRTGAGRIVSGLYVKNGRRRKVVPRLGAKPIPTSVSHFTSTDLNVYLLGPKAPLPSVPSRPHLVARNLI